MTAQYPRPPARAALVKTVIAALEEMKAVNVKVMDVRKVTDVTDCMILASGTSDRHVRSVAERVSERAKQAGFRPMGREGQDNSDWVLVDLNDVIVHVMLPSARELYSLESLWEYIPKSKAKAKVVAKPKAKAKVKSRGKATGKARPKSKAAPSRGKANTSRTVARKPVARSKPAAKKKSAAGARKRG
jgi:ribosome silencing factor RsfS/YbeB/iojap